MQTKQTFKKVVGGGMAAATLAGVGVAATAPAANASVWDQLAQCESGGDWSINTGNGFYGGLQFTPSSWAAMGGSGLPHQASKSEQIMRAEKLQEVQGWGAWPACSAKLGLTGDAPEYQGETGGSGDSGQSDAAAQAEAEQQAQAEAEAEAQRQAELEAQQQAEAEAQAQAEAEAQRQAELEAQQQAEAEAQAQAEQQAEAEAQAQAEQQAQQQSAAQSTEVEVSGETHQVQAGDTLAKIAADHGIENWRDLLAANSDQIEDPNLIYVGDELKLPVV